MNNLEFIAVILAFIVILILIMKKVNLGLSMLIGTIVIFILTPGTDFLDYFLILKKGLINETTLSLLFVIINITILAGVMDKTGLINEMITSLRILFNRFETILVIVPSLLGVLTVPGGAVISAPIVDSLGNEINLSNPRKMAVNLLFRHIWYFSFPFVPGIILTANLIEVDVYFLIKYLFPLSITLLLAGYLYLFRGMKTENSLKTQTDNKYKALLTLAKTISPILIGILLPLVLPVPFWFALTLGVGLLFWVIRKKLTWKIILKSINWNMVYGIAGIMLFKECINSLTVIHRFISLVIEKGIPVWLLVVLLPGVVAYLTGSTSGSLGVTLPLLAVMIDFKVNIGLLVLLYGASFFGYYLSPVHLCLILTAEYFKVNLKEVYSTLFWPTLAGIVMNVILYFIYS